MFCFISIMCVISILKHFSAKEKYLSHCLFLFTAFHKFTFSARYIIREDKTLADALSRNKVTLLLNLDPQDKPHCLFIPKALCELVLEHPISGYLPVEESCLGILLSRHHQLHQKDIKSAIRRFIIFCNSADLPLTPASESVLCLYATHMATQCLKHQCIRPYLSAL